MTSNAALTGLTTIEVNGLLSLAKGAEVATTGPVTSAGALSPKQGVAMSTSGPLLNTGILLLDADSNQKSTDIDGGSTLTVDGALTNAGAQALLQIGDPFAAEANVDTVIATSLSNSGLVVVNANAVLKLVGGAYMQTTGYTDIHGTLDGSVALNGGTLESRDRATMTGGISFGGAATLKLDGAQAYGGRISGFGEGEVIDLSTITSQNSIEAYFYAGANPGTLRIVDQANTNAVVVTVKLLGSFSGSAFTLTDAGASGLAIGLAAVPAIQAVAGDVVVSNVSGHPYSAYEQIVTNGVFNGVNYFFTNVPGQAYSTYEYNYSAGNAFVV